LREVVGRVQALDRVAPAAAIDEVVPVRDDVPERAALVAEGDAAVHAACPLGAQDVVRGLLLELAPVLEPRRDGLFVHLLAFELEEPGHLTHRPTPPDAPAPPAPR